MMTIECTPMQNLNVLAFNRNCDNWRNRYCTHHPFKHRHISDIVETSFPSKHAYATFKQKCTLSTRTSWS